jgi:hypothetical protein
MHGGRGFMIEEVEGGAWANSSYPHLMKERKIERKKASASSSLLQGSADFWAQPPKIRPFITTSTGFWQDFTGCKLVAINLDRPISYVFFQVPANFFFIVMTTGQELGPW